MNKIVRAKYNSRGIKQQFDIYYDPYRNQAKSVVVAINEKGLLRIRTPKDGKLDTKYLKKATQDLISLSALLIAGLVPVGVFADKLQEEFPQYEEASNILREWERIKNET